LIGKARRERERGRMRIKKTIKKKNKRIQEDRGHNTMRCNRTDDRKNRGTHMRCPYNIPIKHLGKISFAKVEVTVFRAKAASNNGRLSTLAARGATVAGSDGGTRRRWLGEVQREGGRSFQIWIVPAAAVALRRKTKKRNKVWWWQRLWQSWW
jgi:hypothetical protein